MARNSECLGQLVSRCRSVFLFRPIAGLKAPTAAKPDSSREVMKEDKVNRADIWNSSGRQVLCLGLPHSARREGADGSMGTRDGIQRSA
jgi:hypothetical protein